MTITREKILKSPYYHLQGFQLDLFRLLTDYMEKEGLNRTQLAEKLGVTKGCVSQILNGDYNRSIQHLFEICAKIDMVPLIIYKSHRRIIKENNKFRNRNITQQGCDQLANQIK